ncbi:hypothetical protein ACFFGR_13575 [Arthrobacter liuii]|uniref:Uncharacterized protein n=1 Tax=Arthrobacter liuii TaxID=1476996 RepID=A0ABQ2B380_9MICC|nr:hypothetical protein [Arthrobacter liuii]GGI02882.1 hypothetical protein GCM10007170_45620 [Arthrobacter liuii]
MGETTSDLLVYVMEPVLALACVGAELAVFLVGLAGVFLLWHPSEGTLSIHSVDTRRREGFYWAAVLTTFALGTAVGDLTAYTLNLGYLLSGAFVAGVIGVAAVLCWRGWRGAVPTFWFVYILTRPLGASFAGWVTVPAGRGGLGWGTGPVSLTLAGGIALVAAYLSWRERRKPAALG